MTSILPTWQWRATPLEPAQCAVFDVDGVISDASHRQHLLDRTPKEWDAFFAQCGDDAPIPSNVALLNAIDHRLSVVLLTARPVWVRDPTLDWLAHHDIRWDLLIMRPERDYRASTEFKREALESLIAVGFEVQVAIDDDLRNVEMYHDEHVPAVYIHSGYYD